MMSPGEPGQFTPSVRLAVERDGARVVVIDSLNGYLSGMPEEQLLTLQVHELLAYLAQRGVLTLLTVAQHGLVTSGNPLLAPRPPPSECSA